MDCSALHSICVVIEYWQTMFRFTMTAVVPHTRLNSTSSLYFLFSYRALKTCRAGNIVFSRPISGSSVSSSIRAGQCKLQKFPPPRMPLEPSIRILLRIILVPMNSRRGVKCFPHKTPSVTRIGGPWTFLRTCSTCPSRDLTWGGLSFLFSPKTFGRVHNTYVKVHKCLEEECRISNQSRGCTLRPTRLLLRCFPLIRCYINQPEYYAPSFPKRRTCLL